MRVQAIGAEIDMTEPQYLKGNIMLHNGAVFFDDCFEFLFINVRHN
jgi:hypothetical protein